MTELVERLRADLTAAMRARATERVRVLRVTLATVANAEAQPAADGGSASLRMSGGIAGASAGLGSSDVERRRLSEADVRALVAAEHDELLGLGRVDDAAVLDAYL